MGHRAVGVVGGGVSGLVAAERLRACGMDVVVFEAGDSIGGQVAAARVSGRWVDVGAESMHLGSPQVHDLVQRLGLGDRLVTAHQSSACIWIGESLRRVPDGVGPVGPTRIGPVMRSRVLSGSGLVRAAMEPLARRARDEDISVGQFVTGRFGHEVTERLVDPLLGNLHSGDVNRLSLHAVAPQVAAMAASHRSLLMAHRARKSGPRPSFATFPEGMPELVRRLASVSDADIRVNTPVTEVRREGQVWRIEGPSGLLAEVDAVVMAVPAQLAADLLVDLDPTLTGGLRAMRRASVATLVASYRRADAREIDALGATGLLVPSSEGRVLKAATFLSVKWPHLADGEHHLVRLAAGRAGDTTVSDRDDATLTDDMLGDLAHLVGLEAEPQEVRLRRWVEAMPQLEVGHLARVSALRDELHLRHPGLVLAGASHDGPGLAACIRSGEQAGLAVHQRLGGVVEVAG